MVAAANGRTVVSGAQACPRRESLEATRNAHRCCSVKRERVLPNDWNSGSARAHEANVRPKESISPLAHGTLGARSPPWLYVIAGCSPGANMVDDRALEARLDYQSAFPSRAPLLEVHAPTPPGRYLRPDTTSFVLGPGDGIVEYIGS